MNNLNFGRYSKLFSCKKMADMEWMYDLKKAASKLYQPEEMVGR